MTARRQSDCDNHTVQEQTPRTIWYCVSSQMQNQLYINAQLILHSTRKRRQRRQLRRTEPAHNRNDLSLQKHETERRIATTVQKLRRGIPHVCTASQSIYTFRQYNHVPTAIAIHSRMATTAHVVTTGYTHSSEPLIYTMEPKRRRFTALHQAGIMHTGTHRVYIIPSLDIIW
jgi:hypothetical protein